MIYYILDKYTYAKKGFSIKMALDNTHFGASEIEKILKDKKRLFFDGIGGVSMCSLARISKLRGFEVSGYDRARTSVTDQLTAEGICVYYEAGAEHVNNCDALIYTVAIPADNPEYKTALSRGIPCISRADYLGYLMSGYKHRIGISGMHGKSTTTSMTEAAFTAAGLDPTVSCGALMKDVGSAHRIGSEDYFIFEACEYMDSFLDFYPTVAVILNIEMDHVDYFHSMEQIRASYNAFIKRTNGGIALINCCDDDVMKAAEGFDGKTVTFGVQAKDADYCADDISFVSGCGRFSVYYKGEKLCRIELKVPGAHCICDALAAVSAAHLCGADPELAANGLSGFEGAGRRMDKCGKTVKGADIYSDYAHHPTEIATTLAAAAQMNYERVFCVFQPHTYSRTSELFDDFAEALSGHAYEVILAPIYSARETNTYGVSSEALADAVKKNSQKCRFIGQFEDIAEYLEKTATANDMIIVMGAGDITKVINHLNKED